MCIRDSNIRYEKHTCNSRVNMPHRSRLTICHSLRLKRVTPCSKADCSKPSCATQPSCKAVAEKRQYSASDVSFVWFTVKKVIHTTVSALKTSQNDQFYTPATTKTKGVRNSEQMLLTHTNDVQSVADGDDVKFELHRFDI